MDCSTCTAASCEGCPMLDGVLRNVTVGRKKRKRKPGAGSAVKTRAHFRSPRGPNKGKKRVKVDGYRRGKPPRRKRKR